MTEIDFAYFNYEHGGLTGGHDHAYSSGRGYDFGGLVRVAGDQGRWRVHSRVPLTWGDARAHGTPSFERSRSEPVTCGYPVNGHPARASSSRKS